jgi:hypothetical protein
MDNFDFKKYLVENKLNEDVTSGDLEYLQGLNTNYTNDELIQFVEHPIFQEYKKDMPMDQENEGNWENSLDEFFLDYDLPENKTSKKMTKPELKEMIRQSILAELRDDGQYEDEAAYDFLREEEKEEESLDDILARVMGSSVDPYMAEELNEQDEEEEVATDIDVDAEEETAGDEEKASDSIVIDKKIVSLSSLPSDTRKILDTLETLRAQAEEFGDQKFITQVGNTITFFTRDFVVAGDQPTMNKVDEEKENLNESLAFPMWNKIK